MGTVKYTGPVASFHCPTEATIRSLKVHFSPKQEGSGTPSPENVREIVGWDGVAVHNDRDGIVIPEEYQKVEYLQNDSTYVMYIDTGISIASDVEMEMQISVPSVIGGKYLLGRYGSNAGDFYLYTSAGNNTYFQTAYGCTYNNTSKVCDTSKHTFRFNITNDTTYVYCDGTDVLHKTILNTITERSILVAGTSMGASRLSCNTYWVRISKGGTLIRNLIPCRRKSDNKPGMYDTVSGEFFTNQGTGEFICGPDIGETTNYTFGVLGKNKLNIGTVSFTGYKKYEIEGGLMPATYTASALITSDDEDATKSLMLFQNETSTIKQIFFERNTRNAITFTLTQPATTVYIYSADSYQRSVGDATTWSDVQLELGSTATTYEPYNPNHTVYGGWVDLVSGEVCEEYGFLTESSGGTLASVVDHNDGYYSIIFNFDIDKRPYSSRGSLCNILNYNSTLNAKNNEYAFYYYLNQQAWKAECRIYSATPLTTVDEAKTYLNQLGFKLAYKIPTPISYHIAPTQLQTFLAQNNVWSNADYVEVEYDLHETQTILARKQFIVANQPHIVKPAAAPLQNFVTDMAAPLRECRVHFEPVQDLHGYDKPWPAGGGKNILPSVGVNSESFSGISVSYDADDETYTLNGTLTTVGNIILARIEPTALIWTEEERYTLSCRVVSGSFVLAEDSGITYAVALFDSSYTKFIRGTTRGTANELNGYSGSGSAFASEGNIILMFQCWRVGTVFNNLKIKIQIEKGTTATAWTPYSNICPISGWTGINIYRTGKNMLDSGNIKYSINNGEKWYGANKIAPAAERAPDGTLFLPKGYYSFSQADQITCSELYVTLNDKTKPLHVYSNYKCSGNINTSSYAYAYASASKTKIPDISAANFQLELGSTTTTYEPYTGTTLSLDWTTEAGTVYGGYVDLVTGEVWKEWHLYRLPRLTNSNCSIGSQYYIKSDAVDLYVYPATDIRQYPSIGAQGITYSPMCNRLDFRPKGVWSNVGYPNCWTLNAGQVHFNISNDLLGITDYTQESTTTAKAKVIDYMNSMYDAGNYFEFVYKIKPTLVTILTPTQLKTLRGTNNIWSNANGDIEVKYWTH